MRLPGIHAICLLALMATVSPVMAASREAKSPPAANPGAAPAVPPLPPSPKSPIQFFRELLGASAADRDNLLADKTPEHRQVIQKSMRVYDVLPADEREVRLRTMELRYYFNFVLRGPATNRAERVKTLPDLYRQPVTDRLTYWDKLSPDAQKQLLEYELVLRISGTRTNVTITGLSSNMYQWQSLPEARRRQLDVSFARIFEMTETERAAAMDAAARQLTPAEREQMEVAMAKFRALPKDQRARALAGFQRFTQLTVEEKRQFFRSAELWEKMSPSERQNWRDLVGKLPPMPPVPPGFGKPLMPLPPLPGPVKPPVVATNSY
jgi:Protein of unknown function (DUF3106)